MDRLIDVTNKILLPIRRFYNSWNHRANSSKWYKFRGLYLISRFFCIFQKWGKQKLCKSIIVAISHLLWKWTKKFLRTLYARSLLPITSSGSNLSGLVIKSGLKWWMMPTKARPFRKEVVRSVISILE